MNSKTGLDSLNEFLNSLVDYEKRLLESLGNINGLDDNCALLFGDEVVKVDFRTAMIYQMRHGISHTIMKYENYNNFISTIFMSVSVDGFHFETSLNGEIFKHETYSEAVEFHQNAVKNLL